MFKEGKSDQEGEPNCTEKTEETGRKDAGKQIDTIHIRPHKRRRERT